MGLDQEINARRAEIRTDGYAMSIGELLNLYREGELDIHPEFQRLYRWTDEQKSRLVESILLGIPIPSIFVSQRDDGIWDVIDGLQRLSTIFELMGELRNDSGTALNPLMLRNTKYLPSLEGKLWDSDDPSKALGSTNQLIIRRAKLDIKIVLRESNDSSKYELFQRLNTGGSLLTDQEVRNAILIMVNADAFRWIDDLAKNEDFQTCIALSDRLHSEKYDLELVTRFLVFRNLEEKHLNSIGELGEFLTDKIVEIAESETFSETKSLESEAFTSTFRLLANSLEEESFRKYDRSKGKHLGGFSISAFEPIAFGIGYHFTSYLGQDHSQGIRETSRTLWSDSEFLKHSGSGVRASTRLRQSIPLGRRLFAL